MCLLLLLLAACSTPHQQKVDEYNDMAYALHYRNLDSVTYYASKAYNLASQYDAGKAEALNNLTFVDLRKMRFKAAYAKLDSVPKITDNQVELLVADIQLMRLASVNHSIKSSTIIMSRHKSDYIVLKRMRVCYRLVSIDE